MKSTHPVALVVLDGFGYSAEEKYNAIAHAHMPHFNQWWQVYPHSIIQAAGTAVGLPEGFDGNSEVGHLTLGAGRILQQPMTLWLASIADGSFAHNPELLEDFEELKQVGGALHIMGLLSDAGVHAHEKEIYAAITAAVNAGIKKIVIHPFLDGRDVAPQSAHLYLSRLMNYIKPYNSHVIIGSVHGRFYAMDRDNNWDRIEKSYRVLTEKQDGPYETWEKVLERNYAHNITDEFILPTLLSAEGILHNGDGILFCNVRPDRARELTSVFVHPSVRPDASSGSAVNATLNPLSVRPELVEGYERKFIVKPLNLTFFMTPVVYDVHLPTMVLFPRAPVSNTLKDVLANNGKTIFTIAETEKYAHVIYFFRGENEEPVATETRLMIHSIPAQNYIDHPEMSAGEITDAVLAALRSNTYDFYLINYANADMVGHSGDFDATVKAVEFLDVQLQKLYDVIVQQMDGTLYVTADHGKAEQMYDDNAEQPRTAHTSNPVPFIMMRKELKNSDRTLPITQLSQVAPFILKNMGIDIPNEMKE